MRVLDLGCGAGDVSFLVADSVGKTGSVVGVDHNPDIVEVATVRAEAMGCPNVSFKVGDIRDVIIDGDFDAVVGRFILMYSMEPVATLRSAVRFVRPGGVVAFHEVNVGASLWSYPRSALHQQLGYCVSEAFVRSGYDPATGSRLAEIFVAAGLAVPTMCTDALIGAGEEWTRRFAAAFGAGILRSVLPAILEYGVATERELDLDTFDERYLAEIVERRCVVQWFPLVGAWVHLPS
jgi:SAM-dependent methyltransferase